jgi:hypothetical protein
MANQGILGQAKPTTGSVLYSTPPDRTASLAIKIANDGTASTYDVALKDYDQKLTLDASTYKFHKGDVISRYKFTVDTAFSEDAFSPGTTFSSDDGEKTLKYESRTQPDFVEYFVKAVATRTIALESVSGSDIVVGDTITAGSAPDTTSVLVYEIVTNEAASTAVVRVGPSVIAGNGGGSGVGGILDAGDVIGTASGSGTISTGGIGTAENNFVFSITSSGGVYTYYGSGESLEFFDDRTYRFNVSDSSMASLVFKLSETINGEWGPDGIASSGDEGTELTTGKTTSGTAGQSGAYVQYAFGDSVTATTLYYYEGTTGTAANGQYGGSDASMGVNTSYTFVSFFVYDIQGTWANSTDTFTVDGTTYTVTAQTAGAFGYVRSYEGTSLYVILDENSPEFAGTNTFLDNPKLAGAARTTATVSSVAVAQTASEAVNLITDGKNLTANSTDSLTSIVLGPGERIVVVSATANNAFTAVGFEDTSSDLGVKVYNPSAE